MAPITRWDSIQDLRLSYDVEGVGVSYFLANYVLQGSRGYRGFLNYTTDILDDSSGDAELARAAVCATGLAGIAGRTGADSVMYKARASYAKAIGRVNSALRDPHMASNDSTLFAVLVLSLFESVACSNSDSVDAWRHHINGAADLLALRGTAQFRTEQGIQIFAEGISHILTLCYRYGHPVPQRLRFLWAEMNRNFAQVSSSPLVGTPHIEVMDLYHTVNPDLDTPFLSGNWEMLLVQAIDLDRRLENIAAMPPAPWHFKTVIDPAADPRIVYRGVYRVYDNLWMANIWNGLCTCRLYVNQVICCLLVRERLTWAPAELSPDGGAYTGVLRRVEETTIEMRDAILASVPQTLGFVHFETAGGMPRIGDSSAGMAPAAGAHFLIWYLFLAASLPITTPETRAWIVGRLRAIRGLAGIQRATYFADMLENDPTFLGTRLLPTSEILLPDV